MRILDVQFSNLNSLQGQHSISFAQGPLAGEGLFAITGPTGAGKSTILDAITLALYGRASRYQSKPSPPDMISRGTADASAEVSFQVARDKCYRASWHIYRARKKSDGIPQPAKRFIYDADGVELASGAKQCDELIVELIGLTPDRFFRSAMLAQGEFARFMQADERERADLLESLTSTELYSELGIAAYRRYNGALSSLSQKRAALNAVQVMSEEERVEKLQLKEATSTDRSMKRAELEALQKKLQVFERCKQLQDESNSLEQRRRDLGAQRFAFSADLVRLQNHQAATSFRGDLTAVESSEIQMRKCMETLEVSASARDIAQNALWQASNVAKTWGERNRDSIAKEYKCLEDQQKSLEDQQLTLNQWLQKHANYEELSNRLGGLQSESNKLTLAAQSLAHQRESVTQKQQESVERTKKLAGLREEQSSLAQQSAAIESARKELNQQIANIIASESGGSVDQLIQEQASSIERLHELLKYEQQVRQNEALVGRYNSELTQYQNKTQSLKSTAEATDSQVRLSHELIEALTESYLHAERIKSFEEHRHALVDGMQCPLCGALKHPYTEGVDLMSTLSDSQEKLDKAKQAHDELLHEQRSSYQALAENEANRKGCEATLREFNDKNVGLMESIHSLLDPLARMSIESLQEQLSIESIRTTELQDKRSQIVKLESQLKDAIAQEQLLDSKLQGLIVQSREVEREIESIGNIVRELTERVDVQEKHHKASIQSFRSSTEPWCSTNSDEPTEQVLDILNAMVRDYRSQCNRQANLLSEIQKGQNTRLKLVVELERMLEFEKYIDNLLEQSASGSLNEVRVPHQDYDSTAEAYERVEQLEELWKEAKLTAKTNEAAYVAAKAQWEAVEEALKARLSGSAFLDREALAKAFLDDVEAARLLEQTTRIEQEDARIESILNNRKSELLELGIERPVADSEFAELKKQIEDFGQQIDHMGRELGKLDQQLAQDDANRSAISDGQNQLIEGERALEVSRVLSELIGSADGKKFRAFTQGLMLSYLIQKANRHLAQFNDRYHLTRGTGGDLDLAICDRYQADTKRPLASLSGGESFLVSLALALGLSDMSGAKVEIDSLFIDEGFGTLDADSLDIAISALESLRGENKMIGIISHVESLKERIPAQIRVEKIVNGRSQIIVGNNLR